MMPKVEQIYVQIQEWDWSLRQCFSAVTLEIQAQKMEKMARKLSGNQHVKLHCRLQRKTLRETVLMRASF